MRPTKAGGTAPLGLSGSRLIAGVQVLIWLFVRPSVWRAYLPTIDPALRPDSALIELSGALLRHPALRQLIVAGYISAAGLVLLTTGAILLGVGLWQDPTALPIVGVVVGVTMATGWLIGVTLGVVSNLAAGIAFAVTFPFAMGLVGVGVLGHLPASVGHASIGIAFGVTFAIEAQIAGPPRMPTFSVRLLWGGIAILVGGIAVGLLTQVVHDFVTGSLVSIGIGLIGGSAVGFVFGRPTTVWQRSLLFGSILGLATWLILGLHLGQPFGSVLPLFGVAGSQTFFAAAAVVTQGALFSALFALPYELARRLTDYRTALVAGLLGSLSGGILVVSALDQIASVGSLILTVGAIIIGLTSHWWLAVIRYPITNIWHILLTWWMRRVPLHDHATHPFWHAAYWDEHQWLPFINLPQYLLWLMEHSPSHGQRMMEQVAIGHQRWASRAAQQELDARLLEQPTRVADLAHIHMALGLEGEIDSINLLLHSFSRISQEIAWALRLPGIHDQRLALTTCRDWLDAIIDEMSQHHEPVHIRLVTIAQAWHALITTHLTQMTHETLQQHMPNPYVWQQPLPCNDPTFIERPAAYQQIQQLVGGSEHTILLLYGQRRVGKTSLLYNVPRALPSACIALLIDGAYLACARDPQEYRALVYAELVRAVQDQLGHGRLPLLELDPTQAAIPPRAIWLDHITQVLTQHGYRCALLMFDQFDSILAAIPRGYLSEADILGFVQHIIQQHPFFRVLLVGTHLPTERARLQQYVPDLHMVPIECLDATATTQLVKQPLTNGPWHIQPGVGPRIWELTRGQPSLIQLLCHALITCRQEADPTERWSVSPDHVDQAIIPARTSAYFWFADIANQLTTTEYRVLSHIATTGADPWVPRDTVGPRTDPQIDQALARLCAYELLDVQGDHYRVRAELIRHWLVAEQREPYRSP